MNNVKESLPVAGYTPQPQAKIDLVNSNKQTEERLLRSLDFLNMLSDGTCDKRWLAIARSHIEQGFMAWNRAIFQPSRVVLPEDGDGAGSSQG